MKGFGLAAIVGILCQLSPLAASGVGAAGLEEASARAKKTGLPLFVIGVSKSCGACKMLEKRLTTDVSLQGLLREFVCVRIDVDEKDWKTWTAKHKPAGNGLPSIFVASAQEEDILGCNGYPNKQGDLPRLLMLTLNRAADFKKASGQLDKVEMLLAKKKMTEAIALLAPFAVEPKPVQSEENVMLYPPGAFIKLAKMRADMISEANIEIDKSRENLDQPNKALVALLGLVKTRRLYGALPSVKDPVQKLLETAKRNAEKRMLLTQAEMIDKGRALEEQGKKDAALGAYRLVISRYPDTHAAELTQKRIDQLSASSAAVASNAASPSASAKKISSRLNMARALAKKQPEKARQYAQEIVDATSADSRESQEAKKLLEQLDQ